MATMVHVRAWRGPALLSYGFRPFFLAAALWAAAMAGLWVPVYLGLLNLPGALPPVAWHVHELLFGYVAAVVAGFLLTAIPNWTGRLPVVGWPLAGLVGLWLAGRAGVALSGSIGAAAGLGLSLAFPLALIGFAAREVVAARNRRNLIVVALLSILAAGEATFLAEAVAGAGPVYGPRIGLAAIVMLISLIGGRVTPSFTSGWLRVRGAARLPVAFNHRDALVLLVGAAALAVWVVLPAPGGLWPGLAMLTAGMAHAVRQARWRPRAVRREPLLWVLHLGYAFVPLGFLLAGLGHLLGDPAPMTAGLHAWTVGAVGLMTLGVMTRATRGHTGAALTAPPGTAALYLGVLAAAAARIAAALLPGASLPLLWLSAGSWSAAFAGFALLYGPMLLRPRRTAAP